MDTTMTDYQLLDGVVLKKEKLAQLAQEVTQLKDNTGNVPGLAVILVGDNPASKAYIGMKKKACEQLGIKSFDYRLPDTASQQELVDVIDQLNADDHVHGILLQLPLPKSFDDQLMLERINPSKDVDGFHPFNVGKLLLGLPTFQSCTPYGVCELMSYYNIDPEGKDVVIVGRSNIVGKPLAAMLMQRQTPGNATVTVCHSRSEDLAAHTKRADILIAAIGQPHFITKDMVKPGAVVIDVGINRVDDESTERGYSLVGDVDFDNVAPLTTAITPVPGGVGPLTIAMLMTNTIQAFKNTFSS